MMDKSLFRELHMFRPGGRVYALTDCVISKVDGNKLILVKEGEPETELIFEAIRSSFGDDTVPLRVKVTHAYKALSLIRKADRVTDVYEGYYYRVNNIIFFVLI